jgi:Glucodextranase, domain B/PASTA domain
VFDTVAIPGDGLKAGGSLVATMRLGLLLIAGVLLAGCGADTPPPRPQKPVQLNVSAPSDTAIVQGATAQVSGTVSPSGARVKVQGHLAQVSGNSFTSTVNLAQGPNVIDVAATARGRATALTAFRVTRDERVAVPELVGLALDDATKQAEQRDLKLTAERGGGFLDPLVPRGIHVCDQSPAPGKQVRRGTTVKLLVARSC